MADFLFALLRGSVGPFREFFFDGTFLLFPDLVSRLRLFLDWENFELLLLELFSSLLKLIDLLFILFRVFLPFLNKFCEILFKIFYSNSTSLEGKNNSNCI